MERVKKQRSVLSTGSPVTIGVVLLSSQNVIYAMRDTLSQLLSDFSKMSDDTEDGRFIARPLVELLGNFAHSDIESGSLRHIFEPYLRFGSSPWMKQPSRIQQEEFDLECGQILVESKVTATGVQIILLLVFLNTFC